MQSSHQLHEKGGSDADPSRAVKGEEGGSAVISRTPLCVLAVHFQMF